MIAGVVLGLALASTSPLQTGTVQTQIESQKASPPRDAVPEKKGTGVIKGRVATADGNRPLRRVQVSLSSPELSEPRSVSTTTQGMYEFKDLPAGRYTVTAARSGFLRLQYGQRRPGEAGRPLHLGENQALSGIDFALPRMSVITGRITDEIGEPLAGVSVFAMQSRYFRGRKRMVPVGGQVRTDDTGDYRLISLDPGDYYVMGTTRDTWTLEGDAKQRVGFGPTYFSGTLVMANAQRVKVALGQEVSGTDFGMVPGRVATISGTATTASGLPLAGESVDVSQEFTGPNYSSMFGFASGKVNADGSFTIKDMAPGDYKLSVRWPGDADHPAQAATIAVSLSGADLEGVTLVAGSGGSMTGRIVTDDGTAPVLGGSTLGAGRNDSRLRVLLRPEDPDSTVRTLGNQDNGRVKDDGTFEVKDVFGANRVSVGSLPAGWAIKSIDYDGRNYADSPFDVRNGQRIDGVTIVITNKMATLRGQLLDEKAQPAEGTVILFPEDAAKWSEGSRLVKTARPDQSGAFEIRLVPAGEYLAAALDYVQTGAWDDPEFLEGLRETARKVHVSDSAADAVTLTLKK